MNVISLLLITIIIILDKKKYGHILNTIGTEDEEKEEEEDTDLSESSKWILNTSIWFQWRKKNKVIFWVIY